MRDAVTAALPSGVDNRAAWERMPRPAAMPRPVQASIAMKLNKNLGLLMLGIYLIVIGIVGLFDLRLGELNLIVPVLALVSGIFVLLGR